ncbi:MAG: alpha/beta hydrolase domain-containing protein [Alphaproteobacteria bacterium]
MLRSLRIGLAGTIALALSLGASAISSDVTAQTVSESRIVGLSVSGTEPVGSFNGVAYVRTYGVVRGVVDSHEDVVGLEDVSKNDRGMLEYESEFEIFAPAPGEPENEIAFIDSENRGRPRTLNLVNEIDEPNPPSRAEYRDGLGNGFFQRHAMTYARVQWQTGLSEDVPEYAQGVGLVILRDFARLLSGRTAAVSAPGFEHGTYSKLILGGKSQSAWMVNTFVAEGFNVDPVTGEGIFDGAISVNGVGNWMALNSLAERIDAEQHPYIVPDAKPLAWFELMSRPETDPLFVDVAAYTDFYRLRAGLTSTAVTTAHYRRYDIPAPHRMMRPPSGAAAFAGCTEDQWHALNPLDMSPYIRAMIVAIAKTIGASSARSAADLPPSTVFALGPSSDATETFNPLPGVNVPIPLVDENAWPVGGIRFPDSDYPLGRPTPVSLPPVITDSIDITCGNRGQFQPYSSEELEAKYGSKEDYLALYRQSIAWFRSNNRRLVIPNP